VTAFLAVLAGLIETAAVKLFFAILEKLPDWAAGKAMERLKKPKPHMPEAPTLFSRECGDQGIDLAHQRLLLSSAFGTYFTGLLEREQSYVNLKGQIETPLVAQHKMLEPLDRIYWAMQNPKGPQVIVIAAEGGMGKSNRCRHDTG
jgi:hypothetical protein